MQSICCTENYNEFYGYFHFNLLVSEIERILLKKRGRKNHKISEAEKQKCSPFTLWAILRLY